MAPTTGHPVRYLWILRHAEAAADAPGGGRDQERPLTDRGRRDAAALGARIAAEDPVLGMEGIPAPDLALCSAAVRTRQTADLVVAATGNRLPLDTYRSLYGAEPAVVMQYVREIDEGVRSALVVGHNPTMSELVWELSAADEADRPAPAPSELEARWFPTCALAVLDLRVGSWEDVAPGCGTVVGLFKPPY